ncbi:carbohydrate ABC transporter permease [Streptomyces sp. TS71-3]|uniref:carbohydrate ABC transporter permease n=1 Tax=Streptomyces sp. TS71-3 TaxID=2733862 RepID=UPI001AFE5D64|nr:carbohydrate ABC transporter permease [Streptomyces sp. TS71-3]GHJ41347.1 sugar ABC transporter permease [Streptomyces sp. TS71-3]
MALISAPRRGPVRRGAFRRGLRMGPTHLVLLVCGLLWLFPFLWTLGSSLKSPDGFFSQGLDPIPKDVHPGNYAAAWSEASFGRFFLNTVLIAGGTVVVTLAATSMAGYVLARTRFPGRRIAIGLISVTMFLPHGYTIIPIFDIIRRLGLLNSLWSVIIVQSSSGLVFATFLFMGYFSTMDRELEDAARVDGAGFHQTFWRVMLPLSGPMLATVGLFTCISAWNSFFIPLVFTLSRPDLHTLSVGMYSFLGQNSTDWTLLCAGSVITLIPIIVVFLLLQRYFVNGLAGAVKQ